MLLLTILTTAVIIQALVINGEEKKCDGVIIDDIYHEIEELKTDIDRPYLLAIDYSTNSLFFSYSINEEDDGFKTAYLNLNTKEFSDVSGVVNGFAQTVDKNNNDVYIGGSNGIYKFNHKTKTADFFSEKDVNIYRIYFKDNKLYYIVFPSQFLFTHVNGQIIRYKDLEDTKVDQFVIDNENIIFFTNDTGLYGQKEGTKDATLYKKLSYGLRALTTDINGEAYACLSDGIYKIDKTDLSIKKILPLEDAFGLAFDSDNNIIYSDTSKLIRLKLNKEKSC